MHFILSLLVFAAFNAFAVDEQPTVSCTDTFTAKEHADFIVPHLVGFGKTAWRQSLARDYSIANGLTELTPDAFRTRGDSGEVPRAEAAFTPFEREDFARKLKNLPALPRAWRLRAVRAFLLAVGDAQSSAPKDIAAEVLALVHEDLAGRSEGGIAKLLPDATPDEIADLKALKIGFVARTLPAP